MATVLFLNVGKLLSSLTSPGERAEEATEQLELISSVSETPLRSSPELEDVAEVNEHEETGEPILVPVVSCSLDTDAEPRMDVVFQYVAAVCERLVPVYADDDVRQFDVRFEFGPDRLIRSRECRRVTVPPDLASRLAEPDYDYRDLQRDVEERDDGDSVTPPVYWGECVNYTAGDAAVVGATAGAGGAGAAGGGSC